PLWLGDTPAWATAAWDRLSETLVSVGEHWDVWTNWYEARLRGDTTSEWLEVQRARTPDNLWRKGPESANAHIRGLHTANDPPDPNDDEDLEEWLAEAP